MVQFPVKSLLLRLETRKHRKPVGSTERKGLGLNKSSMNTEMILMRAHFNTHQPAWWCKQMLAGETSI